MTICIIVLLILTFINPKKFFGINKVSLYQKLNYITYFKLQEIFKENELSVQGFMHKEKLYYKEVNMKYNSINKEQLCYLLKSKIVKINTKDIAEVLKQEKIEINYAKILKNNEEESEVIIKILQYDYKNILKILSEKTIENKFLVAYCYYKTKDFVKAKKIMKDFLENTKSKELKVWCYHNIKEIEFSEKGYLDTKEVLGHKTEYFNVDLEKEYFKLYRNSYTEVYDEVFNKKTIRELMTKIDKYLLEAKNGTRKCFGGFSPLNNAKILVYEFLSYSVLNGYIFDTKEETKNIFLKYLEIVFIAYTNKSFENKNEMKFGDILEINKLDYLELYLMTRIPIEELKTLFQSYKIKKINVEEKHLNEYIQSFVNYVNNEEISCYTSWVLDSFLFIFSYMQLDKNQVYKIFDFFIKEESINRLKLSSIEKLCQFMYKNNEKILLEKVKEFTVLMIKSKNNHWIFSDNMALFLTYYFKKNNVTGVISKKQVDEFSSCFSGHHRVLIKIFLSTIVNLKEKESIKNDILVELDRNFDIVIYYNMVVYEMISNNEINIIRKYETKIIEFINKKFNILDKKQILLNSQSKKNLISCIINLNFENIITDEYKTKLKNIKNEVLEECLQKNNQKKIWEYSIEPKKYDLSKFEIEDLKYSLTRIGIKNLLKIDVEKKLRGKIVEYLIEEYPDDNILRGFLEI